MAITAQRITVSAAAVAVSPVEADVNAVAASRAHGEPLTQLRAPDQ
jgi:hypothetical protein